MTLNQIKAMFQPGEKWHATRSDNRPIRVIGNCGTTSIPATHHDEIRMVDHVGSKDIVFTLENGKKYYTPIPKAKDVEEAREGYLRFHIGGMKQEYPDPLIITVTLEKCIDSDLLKTNTLDIAPTV